MNAQSLARLLNVRDHRVSVARAALEGKRRIFDACAAEEQRLQKRLEDILVQRMQQQRLFGQQMQSTLSLGQAQQRDQYVGHLTDLATSAGEEIVAARKALAKAQEDVVEARRVLRHAMAKYDALLNVKDKMEREMRTMQARRQEEESEEIAARRVAVT